MEPHTCRIDNEIFYVNNWIADEICPKHYEEENGKNPTGHTERDFSRPNIHRMPAPNILPGPRMSGTDNI